MAAETKPAPTSGKITEEARAELVKSQAGYTGSEHSDLVEVKIVKDGNHVKAGQTKIVHPTMAQILLKKGLIENTGKPYERPKFEQKDITVDA